MCVTFEDKTDIVTTMNVCNMSFVVATHAMPKILITSLHFLLLIHKSFGYLMVVHKIV